jgi:hypothetical protein
MLNEVLSSIFLLIVPVQLYFFLLFGIMLIYSFPSKKMVSFIIILSAFYKNVREVGSIKIIDLMVARKVIVHTSFSFMFLKI